MGKLLITALIVYSSAASAKCIDTAGNYTRKFDGGSAEMTVIQTGCEKVHFETIVHWDDGSVHESVSTLETDNILRKITLPAAYGQYEKVFFVEDKLVRDFLDVGPRRGFLELNHWATEFTLDETRKLVVSTIVRNDLGRVLKTHKQFWHRKN